MKLRSILLSLLTILPSMAFAQDVYVYMKSGDVHLFPADIVSEVEQDSEAVRIKLVSDTTFSYLLTDVETVSNTAPDNAPTFTSFKFNNKYNDQVFTDVEATITPDAVQATIGAIGKWLTPSFQISDERAKAWVDGKEQQSKKGRVNFANDVVYTVGYETWKRFSYTKVKDEVWSEGSSGEPICEAIPLTAGQLSTNAPSNYESSEGLAMMLDNDTETYFHSTWGTYGPYEKLPLYQFPYIDIELEEVVDAFVFGYSTRFDTDTRFPQAFNLKVSNDGTNWTDVADYGVDEGVPQSGIGQTYESPVVKLDASCKYIRLTMTKANYKNYLCLSELWLKKVVGNGSYEEPTLISPAQYAYTSTPFGREVRVSVEWLTDKASVPSVYITTDAGILPPDKENYLDATIRIDGAGVYPDLEERVKIRGRGNTSWAGQYGKSPYRLKFDSSKKPFGLTKGKSWVLLANNIEGSMLTNAIAMKVASMVETAGANRIIPIDLYINDEYRGSYNFTQQVGLSNNSIDLDDETNAVLLELDSYYDEDYKFKPSAYNLPTNIKDPDLAEDYNDPAAQFELIQNDFTNFTNVLDLGTDDYINYIDVEMFARFLMVNELVMNFELSHPKSSFLYKENLKALNSRYIFGPVWDFDWAFGYEKMYTSGSYYPYFTYNPNIDYFTYMSSSGKGKRFFSDLRYNSKAVAQAYYKVWKDFMDNHYQELLDYVETYYQYAKSSLEQNNQKWYEGSDYETVKNYAVSWLAQRMQFIYENLEPADDSAPMTFSKGDVNNDGYITVADVACIVNNIMNLPNDDFDFYQADVDNSNDVTVNDVVHAVAFVMGQPEWGSTDLSRPKASGTLQVNAFQVGLGEDTDCPLTLQVDTDDYVALQFDLQLPAHVSLLDVKLSEVFSNYETTFEKVSNTTYRVIVYANDGQPIPAGTHDLNLSLNVAEMLPVAERIVSTSAALLTSKVGEDQRLTAHTSSFDVTPTGISDVMQDIAIYGGKALHVEAAQARTLSIYALDGRCVKTVNLQPGVNTIPLPNGVYIVENEKVMICN